MKLPDAQLKLYLEAGERAAQAERRLGTIRLEAMRFERLAVEDWERQQKERNDAVVAGLCVLGLDPESREHHYHVGAEGTVCELVAGKYVEPVMETPK